MSDCKHCELLVAMVADLVYSLHAIHEHACRRGYDNLLIDIAQTTAHFAMQFPDIREAYEKRKEIEK